MIARILAATALALTVLTATAKPTLQQTAEFPIPEANQGVGVDDKYFYAVDNQTIGKYDKKTGKLVKKWTGLDSALLKDGRIYADRPGS